MQVHHLPVTRTARYVTLGPLDTPVSQLWFAFHGYGQLAADFADAVRVLDDGERVLVVPEGLSRFYVDQASGKAGASWMTREDREREIPDYLAYLDALYAHVTARVARAADSTLHVLGFSQGAATAARWAAAGTPTPDRLVLWAGDVPPDLAFDRARARWTATAVVLVAGTRDRLADDAWLARQTAALDRHRIAHRTLRFDGGHRLDDETLRRLAG